MFTAVSELIVSVTATVPTCEANAFGSTVTFTTAGVVPELGVTRTLAFDDVMVNGTLAPPGSLMTKDCVAVLRSQKLPRKTRSSTDAWRRGALVNLPIGRIMTPESEEAYIVVPSEDRAERPAMCSGSF